MKWFLKIVKFWCASSMYTWSKGSVIVHFNLTLPYTTKTNIKPYLHQIRTFHYLCLYFLLFLCTIFLDTTMHFSCNSLFFLKIMMPKWSKARFSYNSSVFQLIKDFPWAKLIDNDHHCLYGFIISVGYGRYFDVIFFHEQKNNNFFFFFVKRSRFYTFR